MNTVEQHQWIMKYHPKTIDECILPASIKKRFQSFLKTRTVPHLLLTGPAGVGKTTVAKALAHDLDSDLLVINSSLYGNMETLRTDIIGFASSMAFNGNRKYVLLDEADATTRPMQLALRVAMQDYIENCGFILTANYPDMIAAELHSRCSLIEFGAVSDSWAELAGPLIVRLKFILDAENIPIKGLSVLVKFVKMRWADFRKILIDLNEYAKDHGEIDAGIFKTIDKDCFAIIDAIKRKSFADIEKALINTSQVMYVPLMRSIYDNRADLCQESSYPALIERLATYQYQHAFAADKFINTLACMASLMDGLRLHAAT